MGSRLVTGCFCLGILVSSALITTKLWAARPTAPIPKLLGHWDGFVIENDVSPVIALVQSDITAQDRREIGGQGRLLTTDGQTVLDSYRFRASVAANDSITGAGLDTAGRLFTSGGVDLIAGAQGDAGIWDSEFVFVPRRGSPHAVSATLLRPFPDAHAPNLGAFTAEGPFRSMTDPTFTGTAVLTLNPRDRGSFHGGFTFTPGSPTGSSFCWPVRVTTSAKREFVMIGQGKTGRMSYFGSVIYENGAPSQLWGIAKLSLADGRVVFNTFNANLR